ncbi:MAG: DMT family transporter [FCB group bacterium]|nr:DMT family transporter [FCB group bacterium]
MNKRPSSFCLYGAFLLTVIFLGSSWMFNKMLLEEGASPLWAAAIRQCVAALVLLIVFLIRKPALKLNKRHVLLIVIYGIFMMGLAHLFAFKGQQYIFSGLSSIIFSFFPLSIVIVSFIVIPAQEPLTLRKVLGTLLGLLGVVIIFYSRELIREEGSFLLGSTFILLSVFTNAIPNVFIKRDGKDLDSLVLNTGGMLIGALFLTVSALLFEGTPDFTFTPNMIFAFGYLGIFCSALAFLLYFWLLRHVSVFKLSLSAYLTPLVAIVLGYLFYNEILSHNHYIGMLLIFAGIFITEIRTYVKHGTKHISFTGRNDSHRVL